MSTQPVQKEKKKLKQNKNTKSGHQIEKISVTQ